MNSPDPALAEWQDYLMQILPGYRFLQDSERDLLQEFMRRFINEISFESHERVEITDEMKFLVSGHACLLLLGGISKEFFGLKKILIYRRKFRMNRNSWSSYHEGAEMHLSWEDILEGAEQHTGWNPALFRFSSALHRSIGWRNQESAFSGWFKQYQQSIRNGPAEDWQPMDLNDPAHALSHFTGIFFEAPDVLDAGDKKLYELLCNYYVVNPVEWKTAHRMAVGNQPLPAEWVPWLKKLRYYESLTEPQQNVLHSKLHVFLDEVEFEGDRRFTVTEEMKVLVGGRACFLLLGPKHQTIPTMQKVILHDERSRYVFEWRGNEIKFQWGKILENLENPSFGNDPVLQGCSSLLVNYANITKYITEISKVYDEFLRRKQQRQLHAWERDDIDGENDYCTQLLVSFFEQPFDVHRNEPTCYNALKDSFWIDPLNLQNLSRAQKNEFFQPHWREILNQNIGLYKKLPEKHKDRLEQLIPDFLAGVEFVSKGWSEITETMKICVAAEACILILGRSINDYRHLQVVEIWKENPDGHYKTAGDANRTRVRLNWEATQKSALSSSDNYNLALHEFAHVIDNADDAKADSIPLAPDSGERDRWEILVRKEQRAIRSSRYRDNKHLINEYGASDKAEFFTCATESFFEKSKELKQDHREIYEILKDFYQLDPAQWN